MAVAPVNGAILGTLVRKGRWRRRRLAGGLVRGSVVFDVRRRMKFGGTDFLGYTAGESHSEEGDRTKDPAGRNAPHFLSDPMLARLFMKAAGALAISGRRRIFSFGRGNRMKDRHLRLHLLAAQHEEGAGKNERGRQQESG